MTASKAEMQAKWTSGCNLVPSPRTHSTSIKANPCSLITACFVCSTVNVLHALTITPAHRARTRDLLALTYSMPSCCLNSTKSGTGIAIVLAADTLSTYLPRIVTSTCCCCGLTLLLVEDIQSEQFVVRSWTMVQTLEPRVVPLDAMMDIARSTHAWHSSEVSRGPTERI